MKKNKEDFSKHSEALNELCFETKALIGVNRMTLHTWRLKGVLEDKRNPNIKDKYNYYSALDVILIGVLHHMKQFSFSFAELKACKDALLAPVTATDGKKYPALEFYSFLALLYNQPIFIIITYNKNIENVWMLDEKDYFSKLKSGEIENHITICLHKVVKTNLDPVYNIPHFCKLAGLSKDELKIIEAIRNDEYKTIRIIKRDGEMYCLEKTERTEDEKRIQELLDNKDYQNIEVKNQNGKLVCAHRTVRINFKK